MECIHMLNPKYSPKNVVFSLYNLEEGYAPIIADPKNLKPFVHFLSAIRILFYGFSALARLCDLARKVSQVFCRFGRKSFSGFCRFGWQSFSGFRRFGQKKITGFLENHRNFCCQIRNDIWDTQKNHRCLGPPHQESNPHGFSEKP